MRIALISRTMIEKAHKLWGKNKSAPRCEPGCGHGFEIILAVIIPNTPQWHMLADDGEFPITSQICRCPCHVITTNTTKTSERCSFCLPTDKVVASRRAHATVTARAVRIALFTSWVPYRVSYRAFEYLTDTGIMLRIIEWSRICQYLVPQSSL